MDPYVGLVVVLPLFFVLGSLIYRLVIQRIVEAPHSAHMMVTLGLLIFIENLANLFFGGDLRGITTTYTTSSLVLGDVSFPVARLGAAAVSLAAVVGLPSSSTARPSARPFAPRPTTRRAPRSWGSTSGACTGSPSPWEPPPPRWPAR